MAKAGGRNRRTRAGAARSRPQAQTCAIDTSLYIDYINTPQGSRGSTPVHRLTAAFPDRLWLTAPVAAEIGIGAASGTDRVSLNRIVKSFVAENHVLEPTLGQWRAAAEVLADISDKQVLNAAELEKRGLLFDIIIAVLCRDENCALVTRDAADHKMIQAYVKHEYCAPWL